MAWIEDVTKRTQKAKHFYDASTNKWRAEFTIHDRHYKDDADTWQDVDENFVTDGQGFDKKCDKTRHTFRISNGGNRRWYPRRNVTTEYVDITSIQYYTGSQWRNLNLPTPVWTNNKTEWDMADLYASITNTWRRIKTDFILKNSNAFTRLRFAVSFTGLVYNETTGELTSTTDGLVWGYISKPTAHDANNTNVLITQTYDGTYIEWSVDTTGAIFPIYIDPTFTDGYGGDVTTYFDTWIKQEYPTETRGAEVELSWNGNPGYSEKPILKFDVSSLSGYTINSAALSLWGNQDFYWQATTVYFYNILSGNASMTESGACWSYRTGTTGWAGSAGCSTSGTDYNGTAIGSRAFSGSESSTNIEKQWSLSTSAVTSWASGSNYGIISDSDQFYWMVHSSDVSTTGYRPKLVVDYTAGAEDYETSKSDTIAVAESFGILDILNVSNQR